MFVNTPGYFTSISVNVANSSTWDTEDGYQYPHVCDVSCEFTYIGREVPTMLGENYSGFGETKELDYGGQPVDEPKLKIRGSSIDEQLQNILAFSSPLKEPTLTKRQQRKADARERRQTTRPFSRERRELRKQQKQIRRNRYA